MIRQFKIRVNQSGLKNKCLLLFCCFISLIMAVFVFHACKTPQNISAYNLSFLYNNNNQNDFEYHVNFISHDTALIQFRMPAYSLLYKRDGDMYMANYAINMKFYKDYESNIIIDSATYYFNDTSAHIGSQILTHSLQIYVPTDARCVLQLSMLDLLRNTKNVYYSFIFNKAERSYLPFRLQLPQNELSYYQVIQQGSTFKIVLNQAIDTVLKVNFYNNNAFELPKPPYLLMEKQISDRKEDSTFTIAVKNGVTEEISIDNSGLMQLKYNAEDTIAAFILVSGKYFPYIRDVRDMLPPLQYLISSKAYEKIQKNANTKRVLDSIWLEATGNETLAKDWIYKFYTRVEEANILFTDYMEGWQTDRGMIYIVFGKPHAVYRYNNAEVWYYGEEMHSKSLNFVFYLHQHPLKYFYYKLDRSIDYKENWNIARETLGF